MTAMAQALSVIDASYEEVEARIKPTWQRASLFGYGLMFLFFGCFGTWAAVAPLASAVIAIGELRVDTERKIVQHHQGGIIKEVLIQEGDRVREGQVLVRLDPLRANADVEMTRHQYRVALSQEARLLAELNETPQIEFPQELIKDQEDPLVAQMLRTQRTLFDSRRTAHRGQLDIMRERIAQAYTDLKSAQDRKRTVGEQLTLINEELEGTKYLFDRGLVPKPRLLALQRAKAGLEGETREAESSIAKTLQRIGELELQISDLQQTFTNNVIAEVRSIQSVIPEVEEKMRVSLDNEKRLNITAPRAGRVVDLKIHTNGGVIGAGQIMLELVPEDDELIVVARVQSRDIDSVKVGAPVQVRLTSFSQRYTHPIDGVLVSIATDTTDASIRPDMSGRPQQPYYKAYIKLDPTSRKQILPDVDLYSGMPAQVLIAVGERTLLEYWLTPLIRSVEVAMREP